MTLRSRPLTCAVSQHWLLKPTADRTVALENDKEPTVDLIVVVSFVCLSPIENACQSIDDVIAAATLFPAPTLRTTTAVKSCFLSTFVRPLCSPADRSMFHFHWGWHIANSAIIMLIVKLFLKLTVRRYRISKDLTGKVALVTGATSGIGKHCALELARNQCTVLIASRDRNKLAATADELKAVSGNEKIFAYHLDLASFKSVRQCAKEILDDGHRIHILINNAGVYQMNAAKKVTEDGIESTLQVNHFGPFLLTKLLLDCIVENGPARIINVSSFASSWCSYFDFDDVTYEKAPYSSTAAYSLSKLENILFTRELAKQLHGKGVTVNCLHPGFVSTRIFRTMNSFLWLFIKQFSLTPEEGSQTILYLATSDEVANISGMYFDNCKPKVPTSAALNDAYAQQLWACSSRLTA